MLRKVIESYKSKYKANILYFSYLFGGISEKAFLMAYPNVSRQMFLGYVKRLMREGLIRKATEKEKIDYIQKVNKELGLYSNLKDRYFFNRIGVYVLTDYGKRVAKIISEIDESILKEVVRYD